MKTQMAQDAAIPALFRYFMTASLMSQEFDRHLASEPEITDAMIFLASKSGLKMTLWYGMLYVVIEGWQEVGLTDIEIDQLLKSPNVNLLKRFRNGVFHFQTRWLDQRLSDFCGAPDAMAWTRTLTAPFHRVLVSEMQRISGTA